MLSSVVCGFGSAVARAAGSGSSSDIVTAVSLVAFSPDGCVVEGATYARLVVTFGRVTLLFAGAVTRGALSPEDFAGEVALSVCRGHDFPCEAEPLP